MVRCAAMAADNTMRLDELQVGGAWSDVVPPWTGTPAVDSFTLMYPGTGGPVPGYDPITNNATINLFLTGTNLGIRANSSPGFDFGSVAFNLTGPTAQNQTIRHPWSLFGDAGGSYTGAGVQRGRAHFDRHPLSGGWRRRRLRVSLQPSTSRPSAPWSSPTSCRRCADQSGQRGHLHRARQHHAPGDGLGHRRLCHERRVLRRRGANSARTVHAPYSFPWTNVTAGAYTLTARATDNEGGVGTSPGAIISVLSTNTNGIVSGELKKWHRVSITWDGPNTSETNANNPFRNYRLNVTFTHPVSGKSYRRCPVSLRRTATRPTPAPRAAISGA